MNTLRLVRIVVILFAILNIGTFRTGCTPFARAANIMITHEFSFTVISDIVITQVIPQDGASSVRRDAPIDITFTHERPIVSANITVTAGNSNVLGTQVVTSVPGGVRVVWTPDNLYPIQSYVTWQLLVEVEGE